MTSVKQHGRGRMEVVDQAEAAKGEIRHLDTKRKDKLRVRAQGGAPLAGADLEAAEAAPSVTNVEIDELLTGE